MKEKPTFIEKWISLKEAAEISGYHPDYLGYLIRKGEIAGKKAGRDWFITEKEVRFYFSRKSFWSIKDLFFSKATSKAIFGVLLALIFIGISAFLFLKPKTYFQKASGDFSEKTELRAEEIKLPTHLSE